MIATYRYTHTRVKFLVSFPEQSEQNEGRQRKWKWNPAQRSSVFLNEPIRSHANKSCKIHQRVFITTDRYYIPDLSISRMTENGKNVDIGIQNIKTRIDFSAPKNYSMEKYVIPYSENYILAAVLF